MFKHNNSYHTEDTLRNSPALERLWNRYVNAWIADPDGGGGIDVTGREYETILNMMYVDPRAAEMFFDLRLRVVADCAKIQGNESGLSAAGRRLSDAWISGIKYEIACLRYLGRIPGYPDNVLGAADADWTLFDFAHKSDAASEPTGIRSLRMAKLRIPDDSNIADIPGSDAESSAFEAAG